MPALPDWLRVLGLWLVTRALCLSVAGLAALKLAHQSGYMAPNWGPWLDAWNKGDVWLYLDIAATGYRQIGYLGNYGWFPGFPMAVHFFSATINPMVNALLVTNLALLLALAVWWRLMRLDHSSDYAWRSVVFLLAFPSAFYFCAPLSESLYLCFSLGAFWAARSQRWLLAGILGAGAAGTRWVGLWLIPSLLWEWQAQRQSPLGSPRRLLQISWLLLIGLAHLAFCWHLHNAVGDGLGYYHLQQRLEPFISAWPALQKGRQLLPQNLVGLTFAGVTLVMLGVSWKSLRGSYRIYILLSLVLPFWHSLFISQHRLMLVLFPLFSATQDRLSARTFYWMIVLCFLLQIVAVVQFAIGNPAIVY